MKWIEEKQALYKRNQELVEKVGDVHVHQTDRRLISQSEHVFFLLFKMFLLITQFKLLKFDLYDFGKTVCKDKEGFFIQVTKAPDYRNDPKMTLFQ